MSAQVAIVRSNIVANFEKDRIAKPIVRIANRLLFGTNQKFTGDRSYPVPY